MPCLMHICIRNETSNQHTVVVAYKLKPGSVSYCYGFVHNISEPRFSGLFCFYPFLKGNQGKTS